MTKQYFSFKEIFMFGWAKTKQHAWFIALTFIIGIIISTAAGVSRVPGFASLVYMLTILSTASISLAIVRNHHFTFYDLFTPLLSKNKVLKFVAFSILYSLPQVTAFAFLGTSVLMRSSIAVILSIVLILIALYINIRFVFFPFVVVDHENAKFIELIKMSYRITSANLVSVLILYILVVILNMIGLALLGFGLLLSVPVSTFVLAHVYTKLTEHQAM